VTRRSAAALAVGLLALVASACSLPSRYDVATVLGGLHNPWDLAFAPDGSMFFTERIGDISVLRNGQRTIFNRVGATADVVAQSEGGMMGIAVDPSFNANRRIYTCYLTANDVRVVRWTVSDDWTTLVWSKDLVTGIPRSSGRHSGCRTRFEPNGNLLWVTTGDAATAGTSQDLGSLGGKVLRITTEGGGVGGNIGDGVIFAYGFRNPQGISWLNGQPYVIEHGPDRDDEITPIVAGGNGGWAPVGPGYNEAVPMTDLARFPGAMRPEWTSGFPTIAPSGGTFVTSSLWGDFTGRMAVALLKGQQLWLIDVAPGSRDTGGPIVTGIGRLRVAVESPFDGRLYVLTDADPGQILQITPVL
jgi:glucose/arabinose dehydrogenase